MKKFLVSLLALILALGMSVSVFAAGNFISSPSIQNGSQLVECEPSDECDGTIVLTPYSERKTLLAGSLTVFEVAYDQIKDSDDLVKLFPNIKIPEGKTGLAVGDLFYLDHTDCDDHDNHKSFTATISPEFMDDIAGIYVLVNGVWVSVKYKIDGANLVIDSEYYGTYAVVVGTGDVPSTGDSFPWGYLVAMVVSAIGLVAIAIAFKKQAV